MGEIVVDAPAIMAVVQRKPGYQLLTPKLLANAVASSVNIAEGHSKLVGRGWPAEDAWSDAYSPVQRVLPFGIEHAAGDLTMRTRPPAARACLALATALHLPVYTCDHSWAEIQLPAVIHLLR